MKGHLPKAYLRIDPNLDQHPDALGMLRLICAGNRQQPRGYFQRITAQGILGRKRLAEFTNPRPGKAKADLVVLPDGRLHLEGWEHWQEGDLTVGERMRKLREKRNGGVTAAVTKGDTKTSPPSEASRRQGVKAGKDNPQTPTGAVVAFYGELTGRNLSVRAHDREIRPRLEEGIPMTAMKLAVVGACLNPFHLGENDRRRVYLDPKTIFRPGRIEGHADHARHATYRMAGAEEVWQHWMTRLSKPRAEVMRHFFEARDRLLVEEGGSPIGPVAWGEERTASA